jgi:hypothetical protein
VSTLPYLVQLTCPLAKERDDVSRGAERVGDVRVGAGRQGRPQLTADLAEQERRGRYWCLI